MTRLVNIYCRANKLNICQRDKKFLGKAMVCEP